MLTADRTPVAPQSIAAAPPPRVRRELHVFVDRHAKRGPTLTFEPRGLLEREAVHEIIDVLGFPLRAKNAGGRGVSDAVAIAASICERHGWTRTEAWLDEAKDLHVKLVKDVDSPRG